MLHYKKTLKIRRRFIKARAALSAVIVVALIAGFSLVNYARNAEAATSHTIASIGDISGFEVLNENDVKIDSSNPATFAGLIRVRLSLTGSVSNVETLAIGDTITIPLKYTAGSTYKIPPSAQQAFSPNLIDGGGDEQFTVSFDGNSHVITLTKTANTMSGTFNFSMLSSLGSVRYNAIETQSTFYVDGFLSTGYTFPNTPKAESEINQLRVYSSNTPMLNRLFYFQSFNLSAIYKTLLNGGNIENVYGPSGSNVLDKDLVMVAKIDPNPNIIGMSRGVRVPIVYDLMSNGLGLNNQFSANNDLFNGVDYADGHGAFPAVTLAPDLTQDQVVTVMETAGSGKMAFVKNSDGSYTVATNWGKIRGNSRTYSSTTSAEISNFPNTIALNERNAQLIEQSISLGLLPEYVAQTVRVDFADAEVKDSITATNCSNINAICYPVIYSDSTASNTLQGQTTVKVHYVDRSVNPLAEVSNSYGFPAGSIYGTPDAPINVAPKVVEHYVLLTDPAKLADFAVNNGLSASQVLSTSSTAPFPLTGKTELYYVYQRLYNVSFDNNNANTANPNDQDVIEQDTATRPTDPTKDGYTFEHWYVCGGGEDVAFDFTTPITSDVQLCAKWAKVLALSPGDVGGSTPGVPNTGVMSWNSLFTILGLGSLGCVAAVIVIRRRAAKR